MSTINNLLKAFILLLCVAVLTQALGQKIPIVDQLLNFAGSLTGLNQYSSAPNIDGAGDEPADATAPAGSELMRTVPTTPDASQFDYQPPSLLDINPPPRPYEQTLPPPAVGGDEPPTLTTEQKLQQLIENGQ
ncbi:MAG: hypothetical protein F6K00_19500 [Leptolyngbya sp. SIOISBB]|nr:hypothetical protein [Leptolyngbya sp. SIOISBB]